MKTISEQVLQSIKRCGMSCYALSKATGVSRGELSRIMSGQRSMTLKTLDRLAPVLGISIVVKNPKRRKSTKGT